MIFELKHDVYFVPGAVNGAIYDLRNNHLYAINHETNIFLIKYCQYELSSLTSEERAYIDKLVQEELLSRDFLPKRVVDESGTKVNLLNFVWLEVTQVCNMRCLHCYEGETHVSTKHHFTVQEWKNIIKQLYEAGCASIQFIGGEPACYPEIIELLDYAGGFKFDKIGFFTNATLLSAELVQAIKRNRVNVQVSLYGHTAELHETITTIPGSFDKTKTAISRLLFEKIPVSVAITVMKENEQYFEEIIHLIKKLGVTKYKYDLVREVKDCPQNCHLVSRDDLISKKYLVRPNFAINKEKFNKALSKNTCWYGKFAISDNGDVYPCVFERGIKFGNLFNTTIAELLKSDVLTQYWHLDFSQIEECRSCEYRYACKDCRPLGKLNGENAKNVRCLYQPLLGIWGDKI